MNVINNFISFILLLTPLIVNAIDAIPEDLSKWEEKGIVLQNNSNILWENKLKINIAGLAKVNSTYYLFYLAGFDGLWKEHGGSNHQSLGVATSQDGVKFTKHSNNPILKPHDFLPVSSEEEGIRTAYIRYVPSENMFYGFFGVESPGGRSSCPHRASKWGWLSWFCEGNIKVDAAVFLATSYDGINWDNKGPIEGTYRKKGNEVYASGWVHDGSKFYLYVTTAQGGMNKKVSFGKDPLNLKELGVAEHLNWGWSGINTYLHDDNNTVTLIYNPAGGTHPGAKNNKLYFSTTTLNDLTKIENERVISGPSGNQNKHFIFKDNYEWKWYYIREGAHSSHKIKLRTHPAP